MSNITITNLTFGFSDTPLFKNVNLNIDSKWKLGLVGRNGRGKTTLLQLILGTYPYDGNIYSPLPFQYFPYTITNPQDLAIDVIEALYPSVEIWRVQKEMIRLDLDEDCLYMPYSLLSYGQQTKLQLALMFSGENTFMLIDEPTNHLDTSARAQVASYLSQKSGFILISHDRSFLDSCIDHVLSINKNGIQLEKGNFTSWKNNFDIVQQSELDENKRLKKDIAKLHEAAMEKQQWSDSVEKTKTGTRVAGLRPDRGHIGHMAAKMAKKSKVTLSRMEKEIDAKEKLLKNYESNPPLVLPSINGRFKELFSLKDVSVAYGNKYVLNNVNLRLAFGERVAICGKNGCGKSTLLKVITGDIVPTKGTIIKSPSLILSHLPQDVSYLHGSLDEYITNGNWDKTTFKTILRKLGFSRDTFEIPIEKYSQGQKKKVAIAASLSTPAHLYIWDEPLNYIDLMSRIQIEEMITYSNCTMIIVEHDAAFIGNISTKTIKLQMKNPR